MTLKLITDQPDGKSVRLSTAEIRMEQLGVTYRSTFRPNPANTLYITSQPQLEAELGPDLIIPLNESRIIVYDESMTQTKPFKKQAGSSIKIMSHSVLIELEYTGTGHLVQMDGDVIGGITEIENITLKGNFTNGAFAIKDSLFFITKKAPITEFGLLSTFEGMTVLWDESGPFTNLAGISFINNPAISITTTGLNGVGVLPTTAMSFINKSPSTRMDVVFENNQNKTDSAHEFLFIDPNSHPSSSFKIRDSGIISTIDESLFQKGVDEAITAVSDNGSGKLRLTSVGHGQVNKTYTVLSGFAEATFNRTTLAIVIDNNTVDTDIDFVVGIDSGNMNRASLDASDPRVTAKDNPGQEDSMSIAECRSNVPISFSSVIGSFVPIQNTIPVVNDFIQDEATQDWIIDTSKGTMTYIGLGKITSTITFEFLLSKAGGGSDIGTVSLFKNLDQQSKTDQLVSISSTVQKVIYSGGLFKVDNGDVFQLHLDSDDISVINVSALKVLSARQ